jgi:CBS domain containing-hemolysin-like protein
LSFNDKKRRKTRWVLVTVIWTFFLAIIFGFITHYLINEVKSLPVSFLILLLVVAIGIVFDLVGTAAAAANIAPLNAKAARRVTGARRAVYLVKNAEQVANFCNDVVGDISGIISGTIAALIVFKLVSFFPTHMAEFYLGILLTAVVAAITVGGKAWGKSIAIRYSTEVILLAGLILTKIENPFGRQKKKSTTNEG